MQITEEEEEREDICALKAREKVGLEERNRRQAHE